MEDEPAIEGDESPTTVQYLDADADAAGAELVACEDEGQPEPREGMEFDSEDAAKAFYTAYARRAGFRVRISRYTRSRRDNSIISRRIVCSKEGFPEPRPSAPHRAATRVGCKAMIMVKRIADRRWAVTKLVKDHNHGPVPPRKSHLAAPDSAAAPPPAPASPLPAADAVQEPFEGMEFDSEESAKAYYSAYAAQSGFRARISKYWRSRRDNSIISRQVVCSKEGFPEARVKREMGDEGRIKRPRVTTRIGCKAMMVVKKRSSGRWVVSKFESEHNHALMDNINTPLLQARCTADQKCSIVKLQGGNDAPDSAAMPRCGDGDQGAHKESLAVLYNQLCCEAIRYAREGATDLETYNVAIAALREAAEKVAASKRGALAVAQPAGLIAGIDREVALGQGSNRVVMPAKALHDLQCSDDVKQRVAGASGTACSSQGMTTSASLLVPQQHIPGTPSGLLGNGSAGSDAVAGRKRELPITNEDPEDNSIQKSQKLEPLEVTQASATPRSSSGLSSPRFSKSPIVTVPTLHVSFYVPMLGSLSESSSVSSPGTSGGPSAHLSSPGEAHLLPAHPTETVARPHTGMPQPEVSPSGTQKTAAYEQTKPYKSPNPQVHATAIAAGARIVPPKEAATLMKAIEARIRSARALAKSPSSSGCKLFSAETWSPRPCDGEDSQRQESQVQGSSSDDLKLCRSVEASKEFDTSTAQSVMNPDERQIELLDAGRLLKILAE